MNGLNNDFTGARYMGEVKELKKEKEKLQKGQGQKEERGGKLEEIPPEEMTKEQLVERLKEMSQEVKKYYDLYLRTQAEIENLKKRFQKEREQFVRFANESLIKDLLNVIDNLERAVAHSREEDQVQDSVRALRDGIELTLKGMKDILKKAGLEGFESLGKKFDPNYHHAVEQRFDPSVEPGTVVEELQKGYLLNGRLIRPAMVVVSSKEDKKQD